MCSAIKFLLTANKCYALSLPLFGTASAARTLAATAQPKPHSTSNTMTNSQEFLKLKQNVLEHADTLLGNKLLKFVYHDLCTGDQLDSNKEDIDIIAQQLELRFENAKATYISWATIENCTQYSLCLSESSLSSRSEQYTKTDANWKNLIGRKLVKYKVFGYKTKVCAEPHFLILEFENKLQLGVGNFYREPNFIPVHANGDDIWIVFGKGSIDFCISKLNLEQLT
jgi:hypothetical protein